MEFSGKHSFTLHPSLDPYGQNHRWRDTLILGGLGNQKKLVPPGKYFNSGPPTNIWNKNKNKKKRKRKKREKETKEKDKKQEKIRRKILPTAKNRIGKLASKVNSQCLYHDVFTTNLHHFLPNDLCLLKDIIQNIMTTLTSPPKRCTKTPIAEFNLEVASWTTTRKATTAGSFLVFEDNVGEDGLSSQLTDKVNIDRPFYKASIAPYPKTLNDLKHHQKNSWKKFMGEL